MIITPRGISQYIIKIFTILHLTLSRDEWIKHDSSSIECENMFSPSCVARFACTMMIPNLGPWVVESFDQVYWVRVNDGDG